MVCLDTSFIIDFLRGKEIARNALLEINKEKEDVYITAPSIIELTRGVNLKGNKLKETENIREFLSSFQVLDLDTDCAFLSGTVQSELEEKGEMIGLMDVMIGSIALHNEEALLTRNKKHFEKIKDLRIIEY
jgi:tRNA(fMet)-specific endonuclease VapC